MPYDPEIHHRRSIRLQTYDYTQNGAYYVTICTDQRQQLFGEVISGEMWLNGYGTIVTEEWKRIPQHLVYVELDTFVVMPNHLHGVLIILEHDGNKDTKEAPLYRHRKGALGTILGLFKQGVTRRINEVRRTPDLPIWQQNYYEHIVRNLEDLQRIREYIAANPGKWFEDEYFANQIHE